MKVKKEVKKYLNEEESAIVFRKIKDNLEDQPLTVLEKAYYMINTFPIPEYFVLAKARGENSEADYIAYIEKKEAKNIIIIENEQWNMSYEELQNHIKCYYS